MKENPHLLISNIRIEEAEQLIYTPEYDENGILIEAGKCEGEMTISFIGSGNFSKYIKDGKVDRNLFASDILKGDLKFEFRGGDL